MSSKGKKVKRKINGGIKVKDNLTNKKIYTYFSNDEITEIKKVLKTKDVSSVPFVIAATILYKLDLLKKLLKDGYNINQTSQNNTTALIWAVKYKFQDIIEFLLANGADPTIKTDSGENVLVIALDNKLWDEDSFISLWKAIKRVSFVDINFTNKNGHSLLHMCVRKDWETLLNVLLSEKPNVNTANANGVTPLMLACFRNNLNIINALIHAGADIFKEDNHGRISLCYAISAKQAKPPNQITDRIIAEVNKKSSFSAYLKRRLELIMQFAEKGDVSCSTSGMLLRSIQFCVQYVPDGLKMLLDNHVFDKICDSISTAQHSESIEFLLEIANEILYFHKGCTYFNDNLYQDMLSAFAKSEMCSVCYNILKSKVPPEIMKTCFKTIILSYSNNESSLYLLKKNYCLISSHINEDVLENLTSREEMIKAKLDEMKQTYNSMESIHDEDIPKTTSLIELCLPLEEKKKVETVASTISKKAKRRSKVIKTKLTKIKSAELSKRLNLSTKKILQQKTKKLSRQNDDVVEQVLSPEEQFQQDNPIVCSLQHLLQKDTSTSTNNKYDCNSNENWPQWKKFIYGLPFNDFSREANFEINEEKLLMAMNNLKTCEKFDDNIGKSMDIIENYLRNLMKLIVNKYLEYWEKDKISGVCNCKETGEHVPWFFNRHLRSLETLEKNVIKEFQRDFDNLMISIRELVVKNPIECYKHINALESTLLNYEIRGIKTMCFLLRSETLPLIYTTTNDNITAEDVAKHIQNVLNDEDTLRNDLQIEILNPVDQVSFVEKYKTETPYELYCKEMAMVSKPKPKDKRKEIEAKLNTIANGFHLINSTMAICNEDDECPKNYGISDLNHRLIRTKVRTKLNTEFHEFMPNRLKSQINSLQTSKCFQSLLRGEIRICVKEQRVNYIISAGINFSAVELGLDINNKPLAVKRIQKECWVGRILKALVDPLLGLTNQNILNYFACEYEENELILATPLCRWNVAQYVQLLRQSSSEAIKPALSTMQIVKQFLNGLWFLHSRDTPIIHGNLKPSNVFIDFDGAVKIGEFGIHKALYKMIEAPRSSLMWFARETLDVYRNYFKLECSLMSDIQVAGMLIYFILTCGKHPFGDDIDEVLKNIKHGITKLNIMNFDLKDLLLWMMLSDPMGRPNIHQTISHTIFWTTTKKWRFILCCAGVNPNNYFNVEKLHHSIETISAGYVRVNWHDTIKARCPNIILNEENTFVGLLKFIKSFYDQQTTNVNDTEFSCLILSSFPTLPVTLYRTLQNTNWLKHGVFLPFSSANCFN